jgi:hypothetical protein
MAGHSTNLLGRPVASNVARKKDSPPSYVLAVNPLSKVKVRVLFNFFRLFYYFIILFYFWHKQKTNHLLQEIWYYKKYGTPARSQADQTEPYPTTGTGFVLKLCYKYTRMYSPTASFRPFCRVGE